MNQNLKFENEIKVTDPFLNDFYKILQSKAIRRLAHKTQVFPLPENVHARTRIVHTYEVISLAGTIAEKLGLNINLCHAIAAGHDIGHPPYGHDGEVVLSELGKKKFDHGVFGAVLAKNIERKGKGIDLTPETLIGIKNHARGPNEMIINENLFPESSVVMFADKIAYTLSDINDACRYDYLDKNNLPDFVQALGESQRERTKNVINALVEESRQKGKVQFSEGKIFDDFNKLRNFMFKEVYRKLDFSLQKHILQKVFEYFSEEETRRNLFNYFSSKKEFSEYFNKNDELLNVAPVIIVALMTDKEVTRFGEMIMKFKRPLLEEIHNFGIFEILPYIHNKKIDYEKF